MRNYNWLLYTKRIVDSCTVKNMSQYKSKESNSFCRTKGTDATKKIPQKLRGRRVEFRHF